MRRFALAPLPILLLVPLAAGVAADQGAEIDAVADLASAAPPELGADALIRLAAADHVAPARKLAFLEQAFRLAAASPQPYKRHSALGKASGPAGFLDRAYSSGFDALSLQLRAIDALLPIDARKARQWFEEIPPIQLPPVTCEDFFVYDVSRFYDVLGRVAASAFSAKEVKEEEPVKFLNRYVGVISSPVQVAPVARLLANSPLPDPQLQVLVTSFTGALERISGDDRSFTYSVPGAGEAIGKLSEILERGQASSAGLLQAYRSFLVTHLTAARCADWDDNASGSTLADSFNNHLRVGALGPITESESTASKTEGKANGLAWCASPECRAIQEQYSKLIFAEQGGPPVQESQRNQNEWQARVRDFLAAMASWTQSTDATPLEFFREKIAIYNEVLALVPNGDTREFVLRSMVEFLMQTRLDAADRFEWDLPVMQLAGRAGIDPNGFGKVAQELRGTNDPAIALEIALAAVAPRPPGEVMLLL